MAESVWDLKQDLESVGSGLEIRAGKLRDVVTSILDGYKDREDAEVHGVWMTSEEGGEEKYEEEQVEKLTGAEDVDFKLWTDEKYYVDE